MQSEYEALKSNYLQSEYMTLQNKIIRSYKCYLYLVFDVFHANFHKKGVYLTGKFDTSLFLVHAHMFQKLGTAILTTFYSDK